MAKNKDTDDEPKKKGGKLKMILLILVLMLLVAGGTVGGLYAAGMIGHTEEKKPQGPQLVKKGEEDPYAPETKDEGGELVHGEGGSKYRTAYFTFSDDFTANLAGSESLIQLSLAASTRRDGRVLMWLKEHELKIRSKMLVELADTPAESINSPAGKADLQKRLTKAINTTLIEEEGFGGVDNVHFRKFIVQ